MECIHNDCTHDESIQSINTTTDTTTDTNQSAQTNSGIKPNRSNKTTTHKHQSDQTNPDTDKTNELQNGNQMEFRTTRLIRITTDIGEEGVDDDETNSSSNQLVHRTSRFASQRDECRQEVPQEEGHRVSNSIGEVDEDVVGKTSDVPNVLEGVHVFTAPHPLHATSIPR